MSLLKKYGNWVSKIIARRYDLAELLALGIFFPSLFVGTKFLLHKYSFMNTLLVVFLVINLFILSLNLLRRILGKFNIKIPKWMSAIPVTIVIIFIIFEDFI